MLFGGHWSILWDSPHPLVSTPTCCPFASSSGATDVGSSSSHVHFVRDWCVSGPHHLHEELGCEPARQEKQEATGLHLPHQKRGRCPAKLLCEDVGLHVDNPVGLLSYSQVASGMILVMAFFLITYTFHSTWVTSEAYSSPSIVLSARGGDGSRIIFDDFREAYYWLRHNTPEVSPFAVIDDGTEKSPGFYQFSFKEAWLKCNNHLHAFSFFCICRMPKSCRGGITDIR